MQRQDTGSKARLARAWWLSSSTMSRIIDDEQDHRLGESHWRRVVESCSSCSLSQDMKSHCQTTRPSPQAGIRLILPADAPYLQHLFALIDLAGYPPVQE